ncbi:S-adenosyl-L-methionine-dependent methyltransferase [Immersiella caudata]|uniref:S-adenosyl-L-methionine-dependent methyltransferase n=1 Tax=Immersiella caudata TaxID=314043 RepID=A0AA40BXX0_9PEZI|nr:S-adenosyl-L-methionine-dependent methyltransferase [Immersiella caudata]
MLNVISDFADAFPSVEVIGTDISPIQPTWVPPNLKFEIEDCTQEWTFPPSHFDFIHIRGLVGSIDDWPLLYQRAFTALKPGGWLESYEISPTWESDDNTVAEDSAMGRWGPVFVEAGKKIGRSFTIVGDEVQRTGMEEAGFVGIQEKRIKQPIGSWPKDKRLKDIGTYGQLVMERDAEGLMMLMAGLSGWTKEDVTVYVAKLRKEIRSGKHHSYYRQKSLWGQKPE